MPEIIVDNSREKMKSLLKDSAKWVEYCKLNNQYRKEGLGMKESHDKALKQIQVSAIPEKSKGSAGNPNIGSISLEEKRLIEELSDGKKKNINESIEWIYENMGVEDISPADAPSIGAYTHLKKIQMDPVLQSEFYKSVWIKTLVKNDAMEELRERLSDDGTKIYNTIDRALEAISERDDG